MSCNKCNGCNKCKEKCSTLTLADCVVFDRDVKTCLDDKKEGKFINKKDRLPKVITNIIALYCKLRDRINSLETPCCPNLRWDFSYIGGQLLINYELRGCEGKEYNIDFELTSFNNEGDDVIFHAGTNESVSFTIDGPIYSGSIDFHSSYDLSQYLSDNNTLTLKLTHGDSVCYYDSKSFFIPPREILD